MSLKDKTLLLICNDDAVAKNIETFLADKVKRVLRSTTSEDALNKCSNQQFDGFLVRINPGILNNPKSVFSWM